MLGDMCEATVFAAMRSICVCGFCWCSCVTNTDNRSQTFATRTNRRREARSDCDKGNQVGGGL